MDELGGGRMNEPLRSDDGRIAEALADESSEALVAIRPDGRVLFWNHGAQAIYGYSAEEAVGRSLLDLIVPPDSRGDVDRAITTALERGRCDVEGPRRRKDGSTVEIGGSLRRGTLADGHPFLGIRQRDLSETLQLHALRASDARFRAILESAPDAIVIIDSAGLIRLVNAQAEALFGYSRSELVGHPIELLMPARFRQQHIENRGAYAAAAHPRAMGVGLELLGLRKDGSEFPVEISLSPLHTDEGTFVSSAIRDISERKRLEVQMHEASRLKSEFLANMSHELRTPLNAIVGFSELMYDGKVGPLSDEHREYVGDILSSARHLLQLINDILDLAKIEAGRIEFQPRRIALGAVIGEVCDTLRGLAAHKRLDVRVDVAADVETVFVDPARLKQILYNYLSNAIKFTPERGRIDVRAAADGPAYFSIDVSDTGVGIAEESLSRLFVEFQQLDASVAKRYQGTGLGLALTKRLAEAQGGRVGVRSARGHGSTFTVTLPRSAPDDGGAPASPTVIGPVLVVDDDAASLRLVAAALRDTGLNVIRTRNAREALAAAAADPPAVAIVDLLMPATDGPAFIRLLRASPAGRDVPIIVWTIKDIDEAERRALAATTAAIVGKRPGGVRPLVAALERVLGVRLKKRHANAG